MILGVGIDLISTEKIRPISEDLKDPFFQKCYTDGELLLAEKESNRLRFLTERFAVKEAVFKAFRINPAGIRLNMIETLRDENGAPIVNLYGIMAERKETLGIRTIHASISNDGEFCIAMVVAEA